MFVAPNVVPRQSAVGQVANLRADCQSALGRVDNPPQDAILPHKRYVLDFLNNGITSNPATTAQIAAPSHARFIMARLVVCSASQICHASGKRALPAISLTTDVATVTGIAEREGVAAIFAHQIRFLADPADIALGISVDGHSASVLAGLETAAELGLLTIALAGGDNGPLMNSKAVDHLLVAASSDPRVVKELHVTLYHLLWELVHVFFEQPGVLAPGVLA